MAAERACAGRQYLTSLSTIHSQAETDAGDQSAGEDELDCDVVASSTDATELHDDVFASTSTTTAAGEAETSEASQSSRFARRPVPRPRLTSVSDDSPPAVDTPVTVHLPTDPPDSQVTY